MVSKYLYMGRRRKRVLKAYREIFEPKLRKDREVVRQARRDNRAQ